MKLEDAISTVMLHASSGLRMNVFEKELRLLICAARAFSCKECGGTGKVPRPIRRWAVSVGGSDDDKQIACDVCRGDRAEIKVYAS